MEMGNSLTSNAEFLHDHFRWLFDPYLFHIPYKRGSHSKKLRNVSEEKKGTKLIIRVSTNSDCSVGLFEAVACLAKL